MDSIGLREALAFPPHDDGTPCVKLDRQHRWFLYSEPAARGGLVGRLWSCNACGASHFVPLDKSSLREISADEPEQEQPAGAVVPFDKSTLREISVDEPEQEQPAGVVSEVQERYPLWCIQTRLIGEGPHIRPFPENTLEPRRSTDNGGLIRRCRLLNSGEPKPARGWTSHQGEVYVCEGDE